MIEGLIIKKVIRHADERGFFSEIVKSGEDAFKDIQQVSYSETKPGIIKAFHIHDYWEVWCIIKGRAQVVLADLRKNSPTKGQTEVMRCSEDELTTIAIPPNVAHGYRPFGKTPMGIIYLAARAYDPSKPAIESLPHDTPLINFNWNAK
ncbi:MAG TPA: dTDP-4-dehydrorhamnose 3,5-epimerase family protein [Candidatus Paceibacterota bacterium]|nr:dTDP-4-dehydrorhamnose 3,5-epimerase family protein [Candidatus Paceibacterota bacterium]